MTIRYESNGSPDLDQAPVPRSIDAFGIWRLLIALPLVALAASSAVTARAAPPERGLILDGTLSEGGAPNGFHEALDLVTGFNKQSEQMGESKRHYGFDGQPWDESNGILAISNLPAAVAREATAAWLDYQGWRERMTPNGPLSRRVVPPRGNPVQLEFDARTGLVKQATIDGDGGSIIVKYSDWRRLGPNTYPFHRDQVDADGERLTLEVHSARFVRLLPPGSLARASARSHAVPLTGASTSVGFEVTGRKSTHILVPGTLDGKPTRFIFDTGAANYLTTDAAPEFGVRVTGGVNIGEWADPELHHGGYATVDRVALGDAALRDAGLRGGANAVPAAQARGTAESCRLYRVRILRRICDDDRLSGAAAAVLSIARARRLTGPFL